jgi:hypothetical protein
VSSVRQVIKLAVLATMAALLLAGCGNDSAALGPTGGLDSLSPEGQRQDYVDGVVRALQQLGTATQGATFAKAVNTGNAKQLRAAALAWRQGGEQLKSLDPPKDAVEGHTALVKAVEGLDQWNQRIVRAAPNKAMTKKLSTQAPASQASHQFEPALCTLVDAGFDVLPDSSACQPLSDASAPTSG